MMSTLPVLHTPVTCAPNDLAICTANCRLPPEAPMIGISGAACGRPVCVADCGVRHLGSISIHLEVRIGAFEDLCCGLERRRSSPAARAKRTSGWRLRLCR